MSKKIIYPYVCVSKSKGSCGLNYSFVTKETNSEIFFKLCFVGDGGIGVNLPN